MVDGVSKDPNMINELQSGALQQNQNVERLNRESAHTQKSGLSHLLDQADISDAARARLDAEKDVMRFTSLAVRQDEGFDADKVAYFKDLLDSGRINDYLRGLNNNDLADSLLNSPVSAFLH